MLFKLIKLLVIGAVIIGLAMAARAVILKVLDDNIVREAANFKVPAGILNPTGSKKTASDVSNACAGNNLNQLVLVSISKRHLWACDYSTVAYSSPVITGMEYLAADLTPTGTYHIYAKETNVYLIGQDSTGSWDDFVHYWMPFLDNQYGAYGFHDATWRPSNAFGNVSPYSSNASHGCVECPLATAAWLYNWTQIGTTVSIES